MLHQSSVGDVDKICMLEIKFTKKQKFAKLLNCKFKMNSRERNNRNPHDPDFDVRVAKDAIIDASHFKDTAEGKRLNGTIQRQKDV